MAINKSRRCLNVSWFPFRDHTVNVRSGWTRLIILRTFEHHEPTLVNERLSAMRCLFCNAEMVLMEAVQADPTTLPGFEHRTFLCPACHRIERRLAYAGAKAPSAASHSGSSATKLNKGSENASRVLGAERLRRSSAGKWISTTHGPKRRPDSPSTVEKRASGRSGCQEQPSPAKTIDLVSELNRIWDDPRPAADKRLEPPATPKTE